jgi:hypothetical protein
LYADFLLATRLTECVVPSFKANNGNCNGEKIELVNRVKSITIVQSGTGLLIIEARGNMTLRHTFSTSE